MINGNPTRVHLPDDPAARLVLLEVLIEDCYRLDAVPRPVSKVLDLGANVGIFCLAARDAYPDAVIHAYEPNPALERYLREQARVAHCQYFMEAIGLHDGKVTLEFGERSTLTRAHPATEGTIRRVAFRTAIARLGGAVDVVKVDCEGAEWELFKDHEAWTHVRHVAIEYHLLPQYSHDDARQAVAALGFFERYHDPYEVTGVIIASRAL